MTDIELIEKKLAFIETCVRELRALCRPENIEQDVREERFAAHTLQIAIQAALDVASHIVSDQRLGEPESNRELFQKLADAGWVAPQLITPLRDMAGFRNVVVHGYQRVNPAAVREVVENHLDDLLNFGAGIRTKLHA